MTRHFTALFFAIFICFGANAESAERLLAKCADKIIHAPSATIEFTTRSGTDAADFSLIISRNKYRLSSTELEIWYDGATQWTYLPSDREVSITEPTDEELLESNPFTIITHYKTSYNYRLIPGEKNDVELTPKNKNSAIRKAVITINPATSMPEKMIITLSNGRTLSAIIKRATVGKNIPGSVFVYDKNKYPADVINDLR